MNPYGSLLLSLLALFMFNGLVYSSNLLLRNREDRVAEPSKRAAEWLLNLRNSELHWGVSNAPALLALSRSSVKPSEFQLAIKQLDINFLVDRLRYGELELYSDRLIPLAVTLTSLCRSPTHYYDYDLLDGLLDHRRETDNFTFASELLAVCGGDGIIRRAHIRRLVRLLSPQLWTDSSADIDTISMVLMATGCVGKHHGHEYILPFADQIVAILISKQGDDGSFKANTVSTALAVQALQMKGLEVDVNQTLHAAVEWLVSTQLEDGSFESDLLSTTEAMMALSPIGGRAHVHLSQCNHNEGPETKHKRDGPSDDFTIQTSIWVGQPVQHRHNLILKVPVNSTIYEVLQRAQADGLLRFETREYSFGHYIVSINNTAELESIDQRWMIYVIPANLNHAKPDKRFLLKTAVSSYKLKRGERIFFWFQPVNTNNSSRQHP